MQPRERVSSAEIGPLKHADSAAASAVAPDAEFFDRFYQIKSQRERQLPKKSKKKKQKQPEAGPLEDEDESLSGSDADSQAAGTHTLGGKLALLVHQ